MLAACPECGTQVTAGTLCPLCGTPTPAPAPTRTDEPAPAPVAPPTPGQATRYANQWEAILEKLRRVTAPRYHIRSVIGWGGMAGVYLADEQRLGRQVAIKVMSPGLMVDPKLVDRFEQEARTIAQFSHPHIVTIYEVDEREDLHYFAMTYVAGRTLGQVMAEATEPLPINVIRAWLYQIGDGLSYAHHHGVVHRDVKPGNVLLDPRGNALVTDFGIAKVADVDAGLTRTGMLVGTPAYMSPEQCSSGRITGASDQYSLGAMAYQMLTGQPPFLGATLSVLQAHVGSVAAPIADMRPDCPDDLRTAVERMLAKQPEQRWPSLSAAITAAGATPPGLDGPIRARMEELATQSAGLSVAPWFDVVREGSREPLGVTIADSDGRTLSGRRVNWSTDDPLIASIVDNTLLAVSPGATRVVASSGNAHTTLSVTVEADPVPGISVEPEDVAVATGGRIPLEAVVLDWDGSRLADRVVLWSSSESAVARVTPDGIVEGVRAGSATINASTGGKAASVRVTVTTEVAPAVVTPPAGQGATFAPRDPSVRTGGHSKAKSATVQPQATEPVAPTPPPTPASGPRVHSAGSRGKGRIVALLGVIGVVVAAGVYAVMQAGSGNGAGQDDRLPIDDPPQSSAGTPDPAQGQQTTVAQPDADSLARVAAAAQAARNDSIRNARAAANNQGSTGGRATAPSTTTQPQVTQPPQPTTGTVEIGGNLPAGTSVTLVQPDGRSRPISGRSLTLDPGVYTLEFARDGWDIPSQPVRIVAGESARVTANARELPPPTQPVNPTPARDVRADQTAIQTSVRAFVSAFNQRNAGIVVPLLPQEMRQAWQGLLESRDVTSFSATLAGMQTPDVNGDSGTVHFSIQLSFRNRNQSQSPTLEFMGTARRSGEDWRLASLQPMTR